MATNKKTGGYGRIFQEAPFREMYSDFSYWRMDDFIRMIEKERKTGKIFPFIRGLRLSAHLIYAVRKRLSDTDITASWGHILDKDNVYCSRECDVIIHKRGYIEEWDGKAESIMNFKFIRQVNVKAVISCKSYIRTHNIDKEYCKSMREYVDNIWLFAECCGPRSDENIRKRAEKFGYKKFWYLYKWSRNLSTSDPNYAAWNDFVKAVDRLKK